MATQRPGKRTIYGQDGEGNLNTRDKDNLRQEGEDNLKTRDKDNLRQEGEGNLKTRDKYK